MPRLLIRSPIARAPTLREGLRAAVDDKPLVTLQHDPRVRSVHADDHEPCVRPENGRVLTGDFVIGADGHRSLVRRTLDPDHPHATYAGYSLRIGMVKEPELSRARPTRPGLVIDSSGPHYLLGYPMTDDYGPGRALGLASRASLVGMSPASPSRSPSRG
jgi:2-polyprenyl-6-methoxyphenol hydroxylase-like FAD-dependent oxidoreductase